MLRFMVGTAVAVIVAVGTASAQTQELEAFMTNLAAETDKAAPCLPLQGCPTWCGEPDEVQFVVEPADKNAAAGAMAITSQLERFGTVSKAPGILGRQGLLLFRVRIGILKDQNFSGLIAGLVRSRDIKSIEVDAKYGPASPSLPNDKKFPGQISLHDTGQGGIEPDLDLNAPEAWDSFGGPSSLPQATVGIGVVDTGVDDTCKWPKRLSCDLDGQVCDKVDPTISANPMDGSGHGTAMASIIAAKTNNELAIAGVMDGARLHVCKIASGNGGTCSSTIAACLAEIADNVDKCPPIAAINLSWYGTQRSCLLESAIKALRDKKILLVAAAGDDNVDNDDPAKCPAFPASSPISNIISVTSVGYAGTFGSNVGKRTVHLAVVQDTVPAIVKGPSLDEQSKTEGMMMSSPAAAQASGVVALVKAKYPDEDWVALRNRVIAGGKLFDPLKDKTISGRRLRAIDEGNVGSLSCVGQKVRRRLEPRVDVAMTVKSGAKPASVPLRALSINCEKPEKPAPIQVTSENGDVLVAPDFNDEAIAPDDYPHDGEWGASWSPPGPGTYTLRFWKVSSDDPGDDKLTVTVKEIP